MSKPASLTFSTWNHCVCSDINPSTVIVTSDSAFRDISLSSIQSFRPIKISSLTQRMHSTARPDTVGPGPARSELGVAVASRNRGGREFYAASASRNRGVVLRCFSVPQQRSNFTLLQRPATEEEFYAALASCNRGGVVPCFSVPQQRRPGDLCCFSVPQQRRSFTLLQRPATEE
jgi:hypothetical protein